MRRADVLALASRVEALTGPDRVVDALVHCAITGRKMNPFLPEGYTIRDLGSEAKNALLARSAFITENRRPAPAYTASLDAAASLVPAGWTWARFHSGIFECFGETQYRAFFVRGEAATPALALTAAALRAIAEGMSDA